MAFKTVGINLFWESFVINACGYDIKTGELMVRVDEKFYRPSEVGMMLGDASKALDTFGWMPATSLE